jgi:hypothetical protein
MRLALQYLSDDVSFNDAYGLSTLGGVLLRCQDFKGAAVAVSLLGQLDMVRQKLEISDEDMVLDEAYSKDQLLKTIAQLRRDTIKTVEDKVPDMTKQSERIQAAKEYLEALKTTSPSQSDSGDTETPQDDKQLGNTKLSEGQLKDTARMMLYKQFENLDAEYGDWKEWCSYVTADAKRCENSIDFHRGLYLCVYCASISLCSDCLTRLRAPEAVAGIMPCHARHLWLRLPPFGDPMYLGLKSKNVRLPQEVKPSEEDDKILEIVWGENPEVVPTEIWKEMVAKEWDISIEEIKSELSRQIASDESQSETEKEDLVG